MFGWRRRKNRKSNGGQKPTMHTPEIVQDGASSPTTLPAERQEHKLPIAHIAPPSRTPAISPLIHAGRVIKITSYTKVVQAETGLADALVDHEKAFDRLVNLPEELEIEQTERAFRLADVQVELAKKKAELEQLRTLPQATARSTTSEEEEDTRWEKQRTDLLSRGHTEDSERYHMSLNIHQDRILSIMRGEEIPPL